MKDSTLSIGSIAAFVTVGGIVAQAVAYTAAVSFYYQFSLTPEQIGVTPLNALGRLSLTGLLAGSIFMVLMIIIATVLERNRFRVSRVNFSLKEKEEDEEWEIKQSGASSLFVVRSARRVDNVKERFKVGRRRAMALAACIVVLGLLVSSYTIGGFAGESIRGNSPNPPPRASWPNPVRVDLYPRAVLYRWTKAEETPTIFFQSKGDSSGPLHAGSLIGISGGTVFILDWNIGLVIVAPASQVQMALG
jgi:hypothetical protein